MKHFQKSTEEISAEEILELFDLVLPSAFIGIGGPVLVVDDGDMERFLKATKIDRYQYDIGNPNCRFFSGILWGCVLQESVKQGLPRPLGCSRNSSRPRKPGAGHALDGYVTRDEGKLAARIIEPQNDRIITLAEWEASNAIQTGFFP